MNAVGDNRPMMFVGLGVVGALYSYGNDDLHQDATPWPS